jgi:uncharacterized SAM-binding protein YcdF (DUF218 family)
MNKLPHLRIIDDIDLLAVLGHSNKSAKVNDPMTFDALIRCRAAGILHKEKKVKSIALLGGGNDKVMKVAEGESMRNYLKHAFEVPDEVMTIESEGTNTITDIVSMLKKIKAGHMSPDRVVFITSDYNSVRVKLVLEILGVPQIAVFSSERILLEADDYYSNKAGDYLESEEYQERLRYESFWIAKTICDPAYTEAARKELGIEAEPIEYFKKQPRREMKKV